MTPACMGGWCASRDHCARYHAMNRREPAERLCDPGKANMLLPLKPVQVVRAAREVA